MRIISSQNNWGMENGAMWYRELLYLRTFPQRKWQHYNNHDTTHNNGTNYSGSNDRLLRLEIQRWCK